MAESIFTSQVPVQTNFLEGLPVTLGTLFTAAVNGTIDGGRWRFPDTLPVGTVQWLLYRWNSDASGTLLAQESFVAPVASTWNTVNATVPVNITAGQRYVTAVFTPNGRYVFTNNFFSASGVTNGNLTAPQDDAVTPARNGKFVQNAAPAYPTNSFNATCYFVDVLFTAAASATGIPISRASETDVAFPISPLLAPLGVAINRTLEQDSAFAFTPVFDQSITINRANETDSAGSIAVYAPSAPTPFHSGPCEDWEPIWCGELSPAAASVSGTAVTLATEVLWQASGQRFGLCQVTLRPCRSECAEGYPMFDTWWPGAGGQAYAQGGGPRPYWANGLWWNVCGSCSGGCSCTLVDEAILPAPVREVVEVRLDGVVMNPSLYRVDENRKLVRTDQQPWPMCQDMAATDDKPNTWSVTITVGEDVPALGRRAVGELAAEFAKDCAGEECQVPYDVTSLSRQGVNLSYGSPSEEDFATGFLGLRMVRLFLAAYNARNLRQRGKTYDIDRNPRPWRRTNTS